MKSIEVEILGKKYYFKTDNPVKLREHAEYLDSQLEELYEKFNTIDQNKLYVLYSLILTEKYLAEVEKNKILSQSSKKIDNLLDELTIESEI
ncbi:MAG: cell division protein ZapA [Armatimonadetes bacterium]|nr:cell division protein ZapA [Armatimonadota bacterium]